MMMRYFNGVECIKCGYTLKDELVFNGCPLCEKEGFHVNYTTTFDYQNYDKKWPPEGEGFWKYRDFFAVNPDIEPVSLNEGNTPLIHLKKLGKKLGLDNLYVKDESRNPTWSYKDRLCSVAVTKAVQEKAKVITISSTGNHGAATAAYAAAAGIPCVVFTIPEVPETMKTLMQAYGAYVVAVPKPQDRWEIMRKCVDEYGWFPTSGYVAPPIGSNPFGVDGYKTISFEIFEQLKDIPDYVAVPAAYADGIYGIWKGMKDLKELGVTKKLPKMVASEVFGSFKKTLADDKSSPVHVPAEPSKSFSIATGVGTYQGYVTLKESNGLAEICPDEDTMKMQKLLAESEGIYAEASSVTSLVAISKLKEQGKIQTSNSIVTVLTSTGLKDPKSTAENLPEIKIISPNLNELRDALKNKYGYCI
jgi:threonine synthase